ncbi:Ail/Lom family outer membrane beta-barrel protein [Escherichia coli]|uniref:Ail/Lom family outer membrane beta-barrel protein n=11 Tax=Enterobacterales TaxID=91347 RepID=UPI00279D1A4B|nr:Ail/Lom family outer membrane beta-barrel protein [Escherichia coli]MDN1386031.1 hypothetical protein [Escherichia coli]MDQ6508781.1 Ail/Lom family outer membrane beta-barrel protein [Escherichia coli]MDY8058064.1 Ail/Lom family outer membrane beta-barrel protein [Escherichia coli]MDY8085621.1 Ail/Lom family outer membrane beta-barrel protein [Escherichia coli]MDY8128342.1 Ail/Lom family outer membrane beta-barrel protein [Escherichia coli]
MLSAAICLAVSGAPAWASEQQATLSAGYLHARTNAPGSDNLNGINVKYRYEFTDTLGLITSFSYANAEDEQKTHYSDIAPPDIPAGFVAVFNSDEASWHLVEDHRGKTVYDVASGDALFISELGPLPENVTWLSPGGEFQKWNGTAWVKDTEAEKLFRIREAEEKKTRLIQEATDNITILQDAVNFEMATDEEVSMLSSWKKYRVLVSRIDINTAPDIVWPEL